MLPDITTYLSFLGAATLLALMPGPDNLTVLALGSTQGRRVAIAAALGFASGCLLHTLAAALGISALISSFPRALSFIKWLGAAYLLFLAYQSYRAPGGAAKPENPDADAITPTARARSWYPKAVLMNVLNPKVLLFFLAFFPQFVPADASHPGTTIMLLGASFSVLTALIFSAIALFAGTLATKLNQHTGLQSGFRWGLIVLFIVLALQLLLG